MAAVHRRCSVLPRCFFILCATCGLGANNTVPLLHVRTLRHPLWPTAMRILINSHEPQQLPLTHRQQTQNLC
jgi:hypothetical protein